MRVGILLNRITWEVKQIITELEKKNIKHEELDNRKIFYILSKKKDLNLASDCEVILERSLSYLRGLYSGAILELKGYKIVNNYESLHLSGNKLLTTLKLIEHEIPTPLTSVSFQDDSSIEAIESAIGYPAVIKPIIGSWGRMIAKLDDYNSAISNLECRETMGNILQKIYYLQEFIPTSEINPDAPTDLRVFVIGDRCVAAMGRFRPKNNFRSNIAIGGTAEPIEITPEIERLSLNAARAVKGEIVGIDLMGVEGEYKVIEVNGTPQFQGIVNATKINIAREIVEYLENKYK